MDGNKHISFCTVLIKEENIQNKCFISQNLVLSKLPTLLFFIPRAGIFCMC